MSSLNLEFHFNVPRAVIYQALTDQMKIQQYTRAKASVQPVENGQFQMLEGKILGRFLTLKKNQYIKMEWKFNDWKQTSIVEIIFQDPEQDECDVYLNHSKIPANEKKEKIEQGWKGQIMEPMSKILGYPFRD